ncbi:MAG: hypothetical protein PUG60_02980 [Lachnospiraceae bacterium]|nr:hypothetical protein [Lachnospiraceae bacterium]MDY4971327.1 hypothetical protein [Lachnospiraceae bacterium]
MKIGIETMIQTILLCVGCMMLAQMISSNLYILQARTCFHKLADQIECSQMDEKVIRKCREEAASGGYRLECTEIDVPQGEHCILLSLYYQLKVPGMGEDSMQEGVIQGYAR